MLESQESRSRIRPILQEMPEMEAPEIDPNALKPHGLNQLLHHKIPSELNVMKREGAISCRRYGRDFKITRALSTACASSITLRRFKSRLDCVVATTVDGYFTR